MITGEIQKQLERRNKIIDKGSYEVHNPLYNLYVLRSKEEKMHVEYLFPIEIIKKGLRLPFKIIKRTVFDNGKDIIDVIRIKK